MMSGTLFIQEKKGKSVTDRNVIGVVGGVGPYAGLDLVNKILNNTAARSDQEHLDVILMSFPGSIDDRTKYLLEGEGGNPAIQIAEIIKKMEKLGAYYIGIPCNTSHSPDIFKKIQSILHDSNSKVELVNMIEVLAQHISVEYSGAHKIGILATNGTVETDAYRTYIEETGNKVIYPDKAEQALVHSSIYDKAFGIKSVSSPVSAKARRILEESVEHLVRKGADIIVLGCTELPLAIHEHELNGYPIIDTTTILARELIKAQNKNLLKHGI